MRLKKKKKNVSGNMPENKRTNGPVNAHLRSAAYTNKHVGISWYLTPVQDR